MATTTNTQAQQEKAIPGRIIVTALIMVLGAIPPMLDTTIVNIAINDLSRIFSVPFVTTQWVVTGYVLALGIAVPFSGWLVQKFDGKRIFIHLPEYEDEVRKDIADGKAQGFADYRRLPKLMP